MTRAIDLPEGIRRGGWVKMPGRAGGVVEATDDHSNCQ
jgi:hypothetical protein